LDEWPKRVKGRKEEKRIRIIPSIHHKSRSFVPTYRGVTGEILAYSSLTTPLKVQ
jgi:hypothetical protein